MLESGKADAVNRETLGKIAVTLKLDLDGPAVIASGALGVLAERAYCPDAHCPSNVPIVSGEELLFVPQMQSAKACRCRYCGELLEKLCPECAAPVNAGSACMACGAHYVTDTLDVVDREAYARERRQALLDLASLTH